MKCKKFIAIATAAAFALTGTAYADTGVNLATEGSDVSAVIEDISITGDRIEADESSYYTSDMNVNFSLNDEDGISSVAIIVNGETIAEKSYDSSDSIATDDGETMNAESTVETEGEDAVANTSAPLTAVSDSLTISADDIKALADTDSIMTEPQPEASAEEPTVEVSDEPTDPQMETPAEETSVDTTAEATEPQAESEEATTVNPVEEPAPAEEPMANTYNAEMVVTDVNGQIETKEFEINAAPAETETEALDAAEELQAKGLNDVQIIDATTYRVEVNLTCQAVTFFKKGLDGNYTPFRVSVCSSGRSGETTPTGTFTIGPYKTKCARSKWALLSGGSSYAQYLVRFKHGICFHSVPYKTRGDNSKMYKSQYNKLGSVASAGCVRLQVRDAKWIYDNCPNGTVVKVYRSSTASPLGVPKYDKLTSGGTYTWDPTDPDTGNPFNGGNGTPTGIYIAYESGVPVLTKSSDISNHTVNLSATKLIFNGKVQKPSVTIYGLKNGTDYIVTYPEGCTKCRTYTITITGKGSFTGTKTATFTIVPQSTLITSVKRAGSKNFTVKYKKIKKQISGYEIMYSKSSGFKSGNKIVNAVGYKSTSKTVKVGSKGTYYVKVRVYKTINGTNYYSNWSAKKKIKVK